MGGASSADNGEVFNQSALRQRNRCEDVHTHTHTYVYLKEQVTQFWHWLGRSEKPMAGHQEGQVGCSWAGADHR